MTLFLAVLYFIMNIGFVCVSLLRIYSLLFCTAVFGRLGSVKLVTFVHKMQIFSQKNMTVFLRSKMTILKKSTVYIYDSNWRGGGTDLDSSNNFQDIFNFPSTVRNYCSKMCLLCFLQQTCSLPSTVVNKTVLLNKRGLQGFWSTLNVWRTVPAIQTLQQIALVA